MIRPGLCSITFRSLPWAEVVRLAVDAGLGGIEWGADVHVPAGDLDRAREVAAGSAEAGLACPSYGSYLRAGDPAGLDRVEVEAVVATAAVLGATNVRVWCAWVPAADADEAQRDRTAADLRVIAAAAGERGLTVSLEHHAFTLTEDVAGTLDLIERAGSEGVYSYWQPCDGMAAEDLLAELAPLAPVLSHLHVFRWRSFTDRLTLAEGADLWPAVLSRVAGADGGRWVGDRWAFLEYVRDDDPAQLPADAATLLVWLAGLAVPPARPD